MLHEPFQIFYIVHCEIMSGIYPPETLQEGELFGEEE